MALVATQSVVIAGTPPSFTTPASGETCRVGAHLTLEVRNGSGAPITVTITPPVTLPTAAAWPAKVYTVPATTGEQRIPLLDVFADPTTGQATLTYSATTSVTRAVVQSI